MPVAVTQAQTEASRGRILLKHSGHNAVNAKVTKFHNLKFVNLAGCSEVTNAGVQALAEHCPGLNLVSLARCSEVTDAGAGSGGALPGLQSGESGALLRGDGRGGAGPGEALRGPRVGGPVVVRAHTVTLN